MRLQALAGDSKEQDTMKKLILAALLTLVSTSVVLGQDPGWPRTRVDNQGNTLITYQPQIDDWKDFRELDWRMAFSLTPAGGKAIVGAATFTAITDIDADSHMVLIHDIQITNTYFPSLDAGAATEVGATFRAFLPPSVSISLERIVACVPKKQSAPTVQLNNDPPQIFVSYRPAILLDVDGPTTRAPIEKTDLEYVVNTHWAVFFDKSDSQYYFLAGQQWMHASNLDGPWVAAIKLPKDLEKLPSKDAHWAGLASFVPPHPAGVVPTVFYSSQPAQVILFDGQPTYSPIAGTQLAYANNTMSYVFRYAPAHQYFYLISGRWFSAGSLAGPWTFASYNLPPDFAQIPPASPAGQVLSSVPGTEEAKDSVLMAQIPTTVTVNTAAAAAQATVTYDGNPNFVTIQGTSLSYATNTAQKVILVGNQYYLCFQGVWFVSLNPGGPWQTAPSVPQVIYTIPPSSPVYNVTYVTQVTTSDGSVQASSTAGYLGAFVMGAAVGAVLAGGTGYYYPPYVGVYAVGYGYPAYHPYGATYGSTAYYHSSTGAYGVSQTAYGAYGGSATRSASYNPYTGTATHTASASNAYGSVAGGTAYNPYTGASAATKQGSNAYGSWGSSAVSTPYGSATSQHQTNSKGTEASMQTSAGGKAAGTSTAYGNTAAGKGANGDMYADHDGNVYKNTGSGWQKSNGSGGWNSVNTSSAQQKEQSAAQHPPSSSGGYGQHPSSSSGGSGSGDQMKGMNEEAQNRQRGEQSSQRYQQQSHGSYGGGGGRRR